MSVSVVVNCRDLGDRHDVKRGAKAMYADDAFTGGWDDAPSDVRDWYLGLVRTGLFAALIPETVAALGHEGERIPDESANREA